MSTLRRFWFHFENQAPLPPGLRLGCGVTALDRDDAVRLLEALVFTSGEVPSFKKVSEDVDLASLDAGRIRPNMGNPAVRGVWFPLGYSLPHVWSLICFPQPGRPSTPRPASPTASPAPWSRSSTGAPRPRLISPPLR